MPPKGKPIDPGVGVRRSTRERKRVNFGSDFEIDDPEHPSKKARTEPGPQPGTSKGTPSVDPPLPSLDDPDPAPDPKKVTWPSEAEYWKNQSCRLIIVSDLKYSSRILNGRQRS